MTEPSATSDMAPKRYATAGDYVQLLKPRIMMLVVFTAIAGLVAAVGVTGVLINPVMAAIATLAIALGSGAAGAINMWYDRDIDSLMERTKFRPLPSNKVDPSEALTLGVVLSIFSVLLLAFSANSFFSLIVNFLMFFIAFLTRTSLFLDPGIDPFKYNKSFSKSDLIISKFCIVLTLFPIWPAIFFPLKTLPGSCLCPVEPCDL